MANLKSHRVKFSLAGLLAGALPLCAAAAFAQNMGMQSPNMPSNHNMPNANSPASQASGMSPANADNPDSDMMSRAFVVQVMQEGMAQIEMGTIVEQKSSDAQVTQYANAVLADFSRYNVQIMPIAAKLGVNPPSKPSKKEQKVVNKMQTLTGAQLDQAYIQEMVVATKKEIQDFQREASTTQNSDIKSIISQGNVILTRHLQLAQQMQQNHGETGGQ